MPVFLPVLKKQLTARKYMEKDDPARGGGSVSRNDQRNASESKNSRHEVVFVEPRGQQSQWHILGRQEARIP